MKLNTAVNYSAKTHEGGAAFPHLTPEQQLRRSILSCFLWEDSFYENGQSIADRIKETAVKVKPEVLSSIAIECRTKHNLRHVSLLLAAILANTNKGKIVKETIAQVIARADELSEFLAIYANINGVTPDKVKKKISAQVKKGLALAFNKFDAYQLAKYNRDAAIKLRDVLFLCHVKPKDAVQEDTFKKLVNGTLESPDTWEVALSGGAHKKGTFTRLITEKKLGYMALLRNLRNMTEAKVDRDLIVSAIHETKGSEKVLPFRFVAAARACPSLEPELDKKLLSSIESLPKLKGNTVILMDVSGSMDDKLSSKSDITRMDAGATLASVFNCDSLRVFTFSQQLREIAPRRGMAGIDAIKNSQLHGGTYLSESLKTLINNHILNNAQRLIIITDEQVAAGNLPKIVNVSTYLINVGTYKNGIGYNKWVHIDGFSENVIKFIYEYEKLKDTRTQSQYGEAE